MAVEQRLDFGRPHEVLISVRLTSVRVFINDGLKLDYQGDQSRLSRDNNDYGLFFLKVGAFTFGWGLTILAFIQEQVVQHLHWLTPQQFLDGLALGRLTPGPTLILAAFVGYVVGTFWGAVVAVAAV